MPGLRELFGTRTPEPDATDEVVRSRPGVGGLSSLVGSIPKNPLVEPVAAAGIVAPVEPRPRQRTAPAETQSSRRKTSLSLPGSLQKRISQAYHRDRWTMADLVAEAVARTRSGRIRAAEIERRLRTLQGPSSSIKTVALPRSVLAELDDQAGRLRLSRSQLVAVLVDLVLDDL